MKAMARGGLSAARGVRPFERSPNGGNNSRSRRASGLAIRAGTVRYCWVTGSKMLDRGVASSPAAPARFILDLAWRYRARGGWQQCAPAPREQSPAWT